MFEAPEPRTDTKAPDPASDPSPRRGWLVGLPYRVPFATAMLLIIVGAGASFDSDWRRPPGRLYSQVTGDWQDLGIGWRPPLAKDLFDEDRFGEHVAKYPPSQGLMDQLRAAAPAVEQELERIRDLSKDQEHLPRQLLAVRYYLRDLIASTVQKWNRAKPDEMTNFTRLLTRLEPWRQQRAREQGGQERVPIVTFNYDTLLEDALTNFLGGFRLNAITDYVSDPRYKLFKLHGSVNWWRDVVAEWTATRGMVGSPINWAATMFDPPGPYSESGDFHVGGGGYPPCTPCLALPTATKDVADFACPENHLADLTLLLPQVTDVLIIGWRGVEGHFLEIWRKAHASRPDRSINSLTVVDATHGDATAVAHHVVQTIGLTPKATPTFETFSGFVVNKLDYYLQDIARTSAA
jgi:SIR2-like domain